MRIQFRAVFLALLISVPAAARTESGELAALLTPNSGRPAFTMPGGQIHVRTRERDASLALEAAGASFALPVASWRSEPGDDGNDLALCTIPASVPPGTYALRLGADTNPRAVHVLAEEPADYAIAQIGPVLFGTGLAPEAAVELFETAAEEGAALVLVTGVQPAGASELGILAALLDNSPARVVLCPAAGAEESFTRYFGPAVDSFWYGGDGYLCFDVESAPSVSVSGASPDALQRARRAIRPARWSIGLGPNTGANLGIRRALTLFVDNPLDYCLSGDPNADAPEVIKTPWGRTVLGIAPAAGPGHYFLIDVGPAGLRPRVPGNDGSAP